ncbi:FxSxx-COOH cyclophane-containing RiPP peptide [Streptomyces sp. NPDC057291]|uniref:FxSxx-COOH cyclophane-containing RiPP peptide n=1 Tax=Streptomyces sp. NPDC057291 TaxID=3346087 RepID=UPI00363F5399
MRRGEWYEGQGHGLDGALDGERATAGPPYSQRGGMMGELNEPGESARRAGARAPEVPGAGAGHGPGALPDLLGLDLEALRTLDHPVLSAVVADLRERAEQPREMLWGFTNAF